MFEKSNPIGQAVRRLETVIPPLAAFRENAIRRVSPEAAAFVGLAHRRAWDYRVLGWAPVPTGPAFVQNWWIVPIEQDSSQIPARAYERVQAIYQAGLRPRAFIIAHEAPKLFAAPPRLTTKELLLKRLAELRQLVSQFITPQLLAKIAATLFALIVGALVVTLVALVVFMVIALVSAMFFSLLLIGFMGALADPCLIAVTEDGFWVEIDRWWS